MRESQHTKARVSPSLSNFARPDFWPFFPEAATRRRKDLQLNPKQGKVKKTITTPLDDEKVHEGDKI